MSNPNWGQPPQGPQGPPWGQPQQPQPGYGQPPHYGQPPQYGQGQYGQGQYGQPPQYGQGQYGGPPAGGPPRSGGGSKGPVLAVLGVAVVAGLVVLTLFLTGVLGSDSDGGSPSAATEALFAAAKDKDLDAVKANLCEKDVSNINSSPQRRIYDQGLTSYSVGETKQIDDTHAKVIISLTANGNTINNQEVPVVKQDGDWKVCFSEANEGGDDTSDSGPVTTGQPTDEPSYGGNNGSYQLPSPGSTYTLPNGSTLTIPSIPALPTGP